MFREKFAYIEITSKKKIIQQLLQIGMYKIEGNTDFHSIVYCF